MSLTKTVAVFLANGFEDMEAIIPIDILLRGGVNVVKVGVGTLEPTSSHNIKMVCDIGEDEFYSTYIEQESSLQLSALILPGGLGGSQNLAKSSVVSKVLTYAKERNILIAAICAAPALVLSPLGILDNEVATCYPGFETHFPKTTTYVEDYDVVFSHTVVSARGPGKAIAFGVFLLELLTTLVNAQKVCDGALITNNFSIYRA